MFAGLGAGGGYDAGMFAFTPTKRRRSPEDESCERSGAVSSGGAAKGRKVGLSPYERTALLLRQGAERVARIATEMDASAASEMVDDAGAAATCHVCQHGQPHTVACAHCSKGTCGTCVHLCAGCSESFCHFCSTCDYGARYERWFCLECARSESCSVMSTQMED